MSFSLGGPLIRPKSGTPRMLMVMLHGYGADGEDLIGLASYFADLLPETLYVAPNAPTRCGLGAGYEWFAVSYDTALRGLDGIPAARPVVTRFLDELWGETELGPAETVLMGFSQGAMIALDYALALDDDLAAVLAFSGGLPPFAAPDLSRRSATPVFLAHGDADEIVPIDMSRHAERLLAGAGRNVSLHVSPGAGHGIAPDALMAARAFLAAHRPLGRLP